jgi:hypothetical protein
VDLRFYPSISNHLKPAHAQSEKLKGKNGFVFSIFCQNSNSVTFFVYKSWKLSFKQGFSSIEISPKYSSNQLSPEEVKHELMNLLSGKTIIINQNSFEFFIQLGNKDFWISF